MTMKLTKLYREIRARGEGDENDPPAFDASKFAEDPAFKEYISSVTTSLVQAGIEKELTPLRESQRKILDEKKKLESQLKGLSTSAEDEADLAALKAGQLDMKALLDKRVSASTKDWEDRYKTLEEQYQAAQKDVVGERNKLKQHHIKHMIGQAALRNEFFQQSALEDLVGIAANEWELNDSDELVSRDKAGNIRISQKTGKPLTAEEWISNLSTTKPHYFKNMAGSGSKGNPNGQSKTVTLGEWQKMFLTAKNQEEKTKLMAAKASGEIVVAGK